MPFHFNSNSSCLGARPWSFSPIKSWPAFPPARSMPAWRYGGHDLPAIDHLNFAQGEMAMFSTFISWQLMQWGIPYWGLPAHAGLLLCRRHRDRTLLFKPLAKAPILTNVAGFIALYSIINSVAGLIWDFTIKQYPTPFGSSPFLAASSSRPIRPA